MAENTIIPFGKYKGQPIEALQGDPNYLQWLLAQEWFRTRFANVYNVVINYSGEPTETPEHNALQVLFLDDAFCTALVRHLNPGIDERLMKELGEDREERIKNVRRYVGHSEREREEDLARLSGDFGPTKYHFNRLFETSNGPYPPIDVTLRISFRASNGCGAHVPDLYIEIKPTVSDDYPAVLRQMKANRSNVLLLREYTGRGATRKQFIQTLAYAGIRVVFVDEVTGHTS